MKTKPSRSVSKSDSPAFWRTQEVLLFQQVMALVGKSLSAEAVIKETLHLMSELLGLNRGRVVLWDDEGHNSCSIRYAYGLTKAEVARGRYMPGEGITGSVISHGQMTIVQDIDREELFLSRSVKRSQLPPGTVAFLALPIRVEGRTVGVLACHRIRMRNRALADDVAMLGVLAALAGQLLQLEAMLQAKTRALEEQNEVLTEALENASARYGIIGTSSALLRAIRELEKVSNSTASVLLLGDSGTGKELFARALHLASERRDKPFIKVNCAAIPDTLFESELFGYERGAFTGASQARAGLFEQANGGTLFLDEVGELPLAMQGKLLRTLQEGTITRLGAKREVRVDVRVVTATHRDLSSDVSDKAFREDLFYRLNVIPIRLPSLAERKRDIRALALHFLNRFNLANQRNVNFSADAMTTLESHSWPGNIRELSNLVERVVLLSDKAVVSAQDLANFMPIGDSRQRGGGRAGKAKDVYDLSSTAVSLNGSMAFRPYAKADSHPAEALQLALDKSGGNKSRAAQALGLTARQFAYRLGKLGLDK